MWKELLRRLFGPKPTPEPAQPRQPFVEEAFQFHIDDILYLEEAPHFRERVILKGTLLSGTIGHQPILVPRASGEPWHAFITFLVNNEINQCATVMSISAQSSQPKIIVGIVRMPSPRDLVVGTATDALGRGIQK